MRRIPATLLSAVIAGGLWAGLVVCAHAQGTAAPVEQPPIYRYSLRSLGTITRVNRVLSDVVVSDLTFGMVGPTQDRKGRVYRIRASVRNTGTQPRLPEVGCVVYNRNVMYIGVMLLDGSTSVAPQSTVIGERLVEMPYAVIPDGFGLSTAIPAAVAPAAQGSKPGAPAKAAPAAAKLAPAAPAKPGAPAAGGKKAPAKGQPPKR